MYRKANVDIKNPGKVWSKEPRHSSFRKEGFFSEWLEVFNYYV